MDLLGGCGDILRLLLAGVALFKMSCGPRKIWNEAVKLHGLLAYSAAFGAMENEYLFWFLFKADFWLTACVQYLSLSVSLYFVALWTTLSKWELKSKDT
jgi:hypothetical protein